MREQMLDFLNKSATTLTMKEIIMNFVVAFILGLVIFISYRTSHTRVIYSGRFNVSLLMMTMITTLVMSVIGNNVALSLGMVGALSIVRFRTAIKDPRDTAYIFWSIAIGICCGVSDYLIATVGTAFIFVILVAFGMVQDNNRYMLVIRGDRTAEKEVKEIVKDYYNNGAILRVNNTTVEKTEFIYELSQNIVDATKNSEEISDKLYKVNGVKVVNFVCQNDELK